MVYPLGPLFEYGDVHAGLHGEGQVPKLVESETTEVFDPLHWFVVEFGIHDVGSWYHDVVASGLNMDHSFGFGRSHATDFSRNPPDIAASAETSAHFRHPKIYQILFDGDHRHGLSSRKGKNERI